MIWLPVFVDRPSLFFSNTIRINKTFFLVHLYISNTHGIFADLSRHSTSTINKNVIIIYARIHLLLLYENWFKKKRQNIYYQFIDNFSIMNMSISTMNTLDEFVNDCLRPTHRLSCYSPLPSHAAQVWIWKEFFY